MDNGKYTNFIYDKAGYGLAQWTYWSLKKQLYMMRLILAYYNLCTEALEKGASVEKLAVLPVREKIGRFKYVHEDNIDAEQEKVMNELQKQIAEEIGREEK